MRAHEIERFDDSTTCASPLYELIHRYEHGYDEGGYRRYTHVRQRDIASSSRDNVHSAVYRLDPLGRLQDVEVGALDSATYETTLAGTRRDRFGYGLDSLGNRVGGGTAYGYEHLVDPDGLSGWLQIAGRYDHTPNARNEITQEDGPEYPSPVTLTRDEIGSLTTDSAGLQCYYDAWGRQGTWAHVDLTASPPSVNAGFYTYDALGRLCKRSAPWPTQTSLSRVETYFHDGVRRIQEVFTDPVHAETPWADPHGTPPPPQTIQTRMEREYIWAAHDGAGVIELHVAIGCRDVLLVTHRARPLLGDSRQLLSCPLTPPCVSTQRDVIQASTGLRICSIVAELTSGERLNRGQVSRSCFECIYIRIDRFACSARTLQREAEINSRIRVARHELACPLELTCRVIKTVLAQVDDPEVIVRWPVVEIVAQGFLEESLSLSRIRPDQIGRRLSQALSF